MIFKNIFSILARGMINSQPRVYFYLWIFSIHLMASVSLTLPRYLWVVDMLACLKITLLTISRGAPALEANVAA
jgi:hypothetical protein